MRVAKEPKTVAINKKLANGKLLLISTKLVLDKLLLGFPKVRSLENNSN